jgi:hypothetical protein
MMAAGHSWANRRTASPQLHRLDWRGESCLLAFTVKQYFPPLTTMRASSYSNGKAGRYAPSKCPRTGTEADAGLKNTRDLPARNISVAIQRGSLII